MLLKFLKENIIPIIFIVLGILALNWAYNKGFESGEANIQKKWDKAKESDKKAYESLQIKYNALEITHRAETTRITHELAEADKKHKVDLANQRSVYERRLLSSSNRSSVYQRQAESGETECRSLASHAARLDRSLEEGRSLVRELGATLGLRDQQIIMLGNQIKSDRKLLEEVE